MVDLLVEGHYELIWDGGGGDPGSSGFCSLATIWDDSQVVFGFGEQEIGCWSQIWRIGRMFDQIKTPLGHVNLGDQGFVNGPINHVEKE